MRRKALQPPPLLLNFWKKEGDLYFADRTALENEIQKSGNTEGEIKAKMGFGYCHLLDALAGKGLGGWAVLHCEWGLTPNSSLKSTVSGSL